jgi:hypothetical protein
MPLVVKVFAKEKKAISADNVGVGLRRLVVYTRGCQQEVGLRKTSS